MMRHGKAEVSGYVRSQLEQTSANTIAVSRTWYMGSMLPMSATTKKMTTTPQTKKANLTATVHPIAKMTGTPIMEIATMSRNPIKASPQMKTTT